MGFLEEAQSRTSKYTSSEAAEAFYGDVASYYLPLGDGKQSTSHRFPGILTWNATSNGDWIAVNAEQNTGLDKWYGKYHYSIVREGFIGDDRRRVEMQYKKAIPSHSHDFIAFTRLDRASETTGRIEVHGDYAKGGEVKMYFVFGSQGGERVTRAMELTIVRKKGQKGTESAHATVYENGAPLYEMTFNVTDDGLRLKGETSDEISSDCQRFTSEFDALLGEELSNDYMLSPFQSFGHVEYALSQHARELLKA